MMHHINSYCRESLSNKCPHEMFAFFFGAETLHLLGCRRIPSKERSNRLRYAFYRKDLFQWLEDWKIHCRPVKRRTIYDKQSIDYQFNLCALHEMEDVVPMTRSERYMLRVVKLMPE